jgi:XRE family aerobic/anaerobic benzoate catabolism transcriptional regulator
MKAPDKEQETPADPGPGELAARVGARVRAIRSRRGMTRKNLARHSQVSERYLAQLEAGAANISLSLLARIARALGVNVIAFLPVAQQAGPPQHEALYELIGTLTADQLGQAYRILKENLARDKQSLRGVAMVGLRGAGKSTLGSSLARHNQVPFVKLDETIAQLSGMDIGDLISLRGQHVYRRFELQALQHAITDHRHAVLEAGGSLISELETYRLLRQHYYTVWVRAVPEDHMARVIAQGDLRPITGAGRTQGMEDLRLILDEREPDYRLADYTLMTSGRSVADCVSELVRRCSPMLKASW